MIDTIDQQLRDWVNSTVAGLDILMSMPPATVDRCTVSLSLYELDNAVPARREGPRPIELTLRYLVTTYAESPIDAHRAFGQLLFAAIENPAFCVDTRPLPIEVWQAFDAAPRPAFRLEMPLVRERQTSTALITKPVEVRVSPIRSLHGFVLSPDGVPIRQARVEIPGTSNVTYTDTRGRFQFRSASTFADKLALRVVARGFERSFSESLSTDKPILIRFQPQEKRHG